MDTAVSRLPYILINDAERARFDNGQSVIGTSVTPLVQGKSYRVYHGEDTQGLILGVGETVLDHTDQGVAKNARYVHPKRRVVYGDEG